MTTSGSNSGGYLIPDPYDGYPADPWGIAAGPDGDIWFTTTSQFYNQQSQSAENYLTVSQITTTGNAGNVYDPAGEPLGIAAGPDGGMRVAETLGNGFIESFRTSAGGSHAVYTITDCASEPTFITAGPDDTVWFTDTELNSIGQISVSSVSSAAQRGKPQRSTILRR